MKTTRDLRGLQVRGAMGKMQEHLLRNLQSGRYRAGCESRPIETAMGLHLLDSLNLAQTQQVRLARYCEGFINDCIRSPLDDVRGKGGRFNRVVSLATARGALNGLCPPSGIRRFDAALSGYVHHSSQRKAAVLRTLLVDLKLVPPAEELMPAESARQGTQQGWVRASLTAVRILQAHHLGKLDQIGEDEVTYLLDGQSPDGGWEHHLLVSISALLALSKVERGKAAVASGVAYLLRHMRDDGGLPFISNEDNWVTCLAGHALLESGVEPSSLAHVAHYLREQQQPDGGWAYAPEVKQTDADDTCISLLFLAGQDAIANRDATVRATRYLLEIQNSDGGFPTFVRGAASEAEITAKAIQALSLDGDLHADAIRRAWAWLVENQAADGSFREEWNLSKSFPIMHVLGAAAACAGTMPEALHVKRRCVSYLMGLRRPDGWWPMQPDATQPHLLSTAYAMAGLARCGETQLRRELDASAMLMIWQQRADGSFDSPADSLGPRPLIYDVPALATIYCLQALSALAPYHPMERTPLKTMRSLDWLNSASIRPPGFPLDSVRSPGFPLDSSRSPGFPLDSSRSPGFPLDSSRSPGFPLDSSRSPGFPLDSSRSPGFPLDSSRSPGFPLDSSRSPGFPLETSGPPSMFPLESAYPPAPPPSDSNPLPPLLTAGAIPPPPRLPVDPTRTTLLLTSGPVRLPEPVV